LPRNVGKLLSKSTTSHLTRRSNYYKIIIEKRWEGRLARIGGKVLVGPHKEKNHLENLAICGGYIKVAHTEI
jgi:hypothetical protein